MRKLKGIALVHGKHIRDSKWKGEKLRSKNIQKGRRNKNPSVKLKHTLSNRKITEGCAKSIFFKLKTFWPGPLPVTDYEHQDKRSK